MKIKKYLKSIYRVINITIQCIRYLFIASRRLFVSTLLLVVISGVCISSKIYVWRLVIDSSFNMMYGKVNLYDVALLLVMHFGIEMIQNVVSQSEIYVSNLFSRVIDCDITEKSLEKIDALAIHHFEHSSTYDMLLRVSEESTTRSLSIMQTLVQLCRGIVVLIGVSFILWSSSPWMVPFCIVTSAGAFLVNNKFMTQWYEVFNERLGQKRHIKILKAMCVRYDNIKELRIYKSTELIKKMIVKTLKTYLNEDKRMRAQFFKEMTIVSEIDHVCTYLAKSWVLYHSIVTKVSVGQFLSCIQSVDVFKNTTDEVLNLCTQAYEDSMYLESFFELMSIDTEEASEQKKNSIYVESVESVECVNLSFKYPYTERFVIQDFNYIFVKGKSYGLVGLNGSGKSTLLKLLLGLYKHYDGEILINGIELRTLSLQNYYDCVSVIFQDFIKYPLDVLTNISVAAPIFCDSKNIKEAVEKVAKLACAHDFIEQLPFAYETTLGKEWTNGAELSIGQWQKIAIARAFLKPSSLLIMDEPTAAVDSDTEVEIFRNFSHLVSDKIGVVVTHRLSNIHFVNEILVLDQGLLVEHGTHEALMRAQGTYKKLYVEQAKLYVVNADEFLTYVV